MERKWFGIVFLLSLFFSSFDCRSIFDFGAIANENSDEASHANSRAITEAFLSANANDTDRVILIPSGYEFYIYNIGVWNVHNVVLQIDGSLKASNNISGWPLPNDVNGTLAALYIEASSSIKITGSGVFDGQGYYWWWETIVLERERRPHLVVMNQVSGIYIDLANAINSPQFHFKLDDVENVIVRNINIYVDTEGQKEILRKKGYVDPKTDIPTFPLNTDGIDPAGNNVLIENVTIQNYDDAVAVKPCTTRGKYCTCSGNMMIRNSKVVYGVGMTIGSVPPNDHVNCVRNVTFENITSINPFKAIYIKSNPGNRGTGIIDQITYRNFFIDGSIWYPIWIGPQQQHQPGTNGTGCAFFYPIDPECPTQPLVSMTNIKLQNLTIINTITLPGVILCDYFNPCRNITFDTVHNSGGFVVQDSYVCQNVEGQVINSFPVPSCITSPPPTNQTNS